MHALGRFVQDLMDARRMTRPALERASGLSRQHIHQLLDDRKTGLGRMVEESTISALATAFPDIGETAFIAKAAESLGVPVDRLSVVDTDLNQLSDEALLGILALRLERRRTPDSAATGGGPRAADRPGDPATEPTVPLAARRSGRTRRRIAADDPDRA